MRYLIQFIFFLLLLIAPQLSVAATYWIATDGVDTALRDGSTLEPWATLNYAIAQSVNDDTIKVKAGSYTLTSVVLITGVTGLTITADNTSDMPIMTKTTEGVVRIATDATNTEISYLTLDNGERHTTSYWYGLIAIDASWAYIHHNILRDGWQGVEINLGVGQEISYNTMYNFGTVGTSATAGSGFGIAQTSAGGTSWADKVYIHHNDVSDAGGDSYQCERNAGTQYVEIAYNDFWGNGEDSIDLKFPTNFRIHHNTLRDNAGNGIVTHSTCKSLECGADNIEFYNNSVSGNNLWGIFASGNSNNWELYNNIIYGNATVYDASNIPVGMYLAESDSVAYNNTIFDNGKKGGYYGAATLKNNAFFDNGLLGWIDPKGNGPWGNIASGSSGVIDHNYVYPTTMGQTGTNAVTAADPMFTDIDNNDVSLLVGSPLIDAGTTVPITIDYLDAPRPFNILYDIGAYEFGALDPVESLLDVTITSPTTETTYSTSASTVTLGGTAAADTYVSFVKWVNSTGGSGNATGTTSWSIVDLPLSLGANIITVTATDSENNTISAVLTVTRLSAETSNLTNFSSYTSGVNLSDWADHWSTGDTTYFATSTPASILPVGTKQCFYKKTSAIINSITWTTVGEVSNADILAKISTDGVDLASGQLYIFARVSGTTGFENCYYVSFTEFAIRLGKYVNGVGSFLEGPSGTAQVSADYTIPTTSYIRFNLDGSDIKMKLWSANTVEPNDWLLTASDFSLPSGGVGFGALKAANEYEIDYFGVVTW